MSAGKVDVIGDLHGVIRIARAASAGVTGNQERIARAGHAVSAFAALIVAAENAMVLCSEACKGPETAMRRDAISRRDKLAEALARVGGAA